MHYNTPSVRAITFIYWLIYHLFSRVLLKLYVSVAPGDGEGSVITLQLVKSADALLSQEIIHLGENASHWLI